MRRRTGHADTPHDRLHGREHRHGGRPLQREDYLVKGQTDARSLLRAIRYAIDRKRAQEALREADRRKEVFLATLAHELRNPLAPIRNSLSILSQTGDDVAVFRRVRGIMERQVQILSHLVDDLLDVSRISRGKIELRKERLDVAAVVHRAVETSQPLVKEGRHELAVTLSGEPLYVHGDAVRLAQVLSNLLNNAAKYTPRGAT